jgi:hypothetical protein
MNDDASLFMILISYTTVGFVLFIYMANSHIFIANETSILPQVVDQVKIPPTSIQYCFIIMLFVVFSLSPLKALVCNLN